MMCRKRGGEPLGGEGPRYPRAHRTQDGGADGLGLQSRALEDPGSHAPALPQQSKQEMLRTHIAVPQLRGALLGQTQSGLGPLGKIHVVQTITSFCGESESPGSFLDRPHGNASFLSKIRSHKSWKFCHPKIYPVFCEFSIAILKIRVTMWLV